jgi:hypothetical protein
MSDFDRSAVRDYWHITMNGEPLCKTSAADVEKCFHAEESSAHSAAFNLRHQYRDIVVDVVAGDCPGHDWHITINGKPMCQMHVGPCAYNRRGYAEAWLALFKKKLPNDEVELIEGSCPESAAFAHELRRTGHD